MNISIVISLLNEAESLPELITWIEKVMQENNFTYEIILVDDGSRDASWSVIQAHRAKNSAIKGIKFRRNYGKSAAIYVGFEAAQGDVIITMDADLQDSPEEIPELYKMITQQDFDLVSGWKKKRYDPVFTKNIPSKLFNWAARKASGLKLHDFNCGLKAYKNNVVKTIEVYGEMHRWIPVLAVRAGFNKIGEKVVVHQKRKYGNTKFGIDRFINGFLDLLSIVVISKFAKRPMHFFGLWGSLSFLLGFFILLYLTIAKFIFLEYKMTERPLFFLGLLAIIFGTQLFITGFLAEFISRSSHERNKYQIEQIIS
jgi:glycosyltransferase involved in cell wall biosynthesis